MELATGLVFQIAILVMSVVIHEVSHGVAAYIQGDKTAAYAGRLTLNPIPHLDPVGSILVPIVLVLISSPVLFGWAKPVPYNPYNLKNQKWGPAMVGAAGPIANLSIALIFGLIIRFAPGLVPPAFVNVAFIIVAINVILAVFNFLPIPPLDGSKVLFALLPYKYMRVQMALEQYGFIILIAFILFFSGSIGFIANILIKLFTGL
jgi:Zn-dependent protease